MKNVPNLETIIQEMENYTKQILENSRSEFGRKSACPFVKREREEQKIEYRLCDITADGPSDDVLRVIRQFGTEQKYSTLLVIDPVKRVSADQLIEIGIAVSEMTRGDRLIAIGVHPDDPFEIGGYRTRLIPYVTLLVQATEYLQWAKDKIKASSYYANWSPLALKGNWEQIGKFLPAPTKSETK